MKSIEMSGKTVEDAVSAGVKALGCDPADVKIDVLDMGSPGLFGMFGRLAKVRLTVEEDDSFEFEMPEMSLNQSKPKKEAPKPAAKRPAPKQEEPKEEPKAEKPEAKPAPKAEEVKAQSEAAPVETEAPKAEKKAEPKPAPKAEKSESARAPRARRPKQAPAAEKAAAPLSDRLPFDQMPELNVETLSDAQKTVYEFLSKITKEMGADVEMRMTEKDGTINVSMMGDELGILIGRRGETLDALQYLTGLYVNKHREDYIRVSLDSEHYRAKREEALTRLAGRMAARARKTGRKVTLEPMNPYERRVLHSALQNDPYVTTHSEGEEPYRRVVITLKD